MTEPMSREERQALIDAPHYVDGWQVTDAQAQRLLDIAEDHARLVAECDALKREVGHRKAMQPTDRDDRPITQAAANRLMIIALDDYPALRAELARIRAHIESSHNEVTCSQDARHANDGDDRVPMLTCMTLEAHTLRAENAKLRKGWDDECVQAQGYAEDAAKLRERVGKLEAVERAARKAWGMAAFPDVNYGLSDALAALDEEDSK